MTKPRARQASRQTDRMTDRHIHTERLNIFTDFICTIGMMLCTYSKYKDKSKLTYQLASGDSCECSKILYQKQYCANVYCCYTTLPCAWLQIVNTHQLVFIPPGSV